MGCTQSKIDNEESVSRCKERRNFMKEAVTARNAFASAHSGYAMSLKNTGAALSDYAQGEAPPSATTSVPVEPSLEPPRPPPPPESPFPPPPPPLPTFSPSPVPPLQRSMTMPEFSSSKPTRLKMKGIDENEDGDENEEEEGEIKSRRKMGRPRKNNLRRNGSEDISPVTPVRTPTPPPPPEIKGMAWDYFFMVDENMPGSSLGGVEEGDYGMEEENDNEDQRFDHVVNGHDDSGVEFKTPEKVGIDRGMETEEEVTPVTASDKHFVHSNTAPAGIRGGDNSGKAVSNGVELLKILGDVDDHFLKASECAQEVSKMLEATRMHYHSNFADNRGHIDHAARVMKVITWNRSFRGVPNGDAALDDPDADEYETHATVLDKLLAWEKKLYEEVKTGELMKMEYQRKVAVLNKLKKRGATTESLEKAKAAVSHLHTRYIVDMQSLDSTVLEVNDIRDKQLYPKLVALVNGMAKMWEAMLVHHTNQMNIVTDLKSLDIAGTPLETSKHHHERTRQLLHVVEDWLSHLNKLVTNQKLYVNSLNSWLKQNLIPIESSLKEKISSPPRIQNPPIQSLLQMWHDHLEKLPDEVPKSAIGSFAAVVKTILDHQEEEMKLKEKWEETRKEYLRKSQAYDDWYHKYMQRRTPPSDETGADGGEETTNPKDPITERRFVVESLKKRLDDEMEAHRKHCIQVREKSLGSLKIRLPELFRAMSDYARACLDSYHSLRVLTQSQNANSGSS
ncbi:OLC1v1028981C1 [Oldenlandia corymbosa var. corymbosa]|uniref:OLC1v1028981C1 n=1 Tax=Oldenlandia corymbosa var. corymbosa TaxID=529605 RepID=A0AAV1CCZ9_OLDCO|nr:OLC1v1028981C1 [Oldenlandia corymbosa var. corymbosa]